MFLERKKELKGHIAALISVLIWGTTFVASKTLLASIQPFEIIFFRFLLAFLVLFIMRPKIIKTKGWREEMLFVIAGLTGVTLYFGLEITALTYTTASNVGIIISISPFFTAILAKFFLKENSIHKNFIIGFILALTGVIFITTQGKFSFQIHILGDILALLSVLCWAVYSLVSQKISTLGYHSVSTTHRIFFYGLLFMLPVVFASNFDWRHFPFNSLVNMTSLLYLGLGASALCFLTWGVSIKNLGPVKTSIYLYLVPIISVLSSALVLKETIGVYSVIGVVLILLGLFFSESKGKNSQRT